MTRLNASPTFTGHAPQPAIGNGSVAILEVASPSICSHLLQVLELPSIGDAIVPFSITRAPSSLLGTQFWASQLPVCLHVGTSTVTMPSIASGCTSSCSDRIIPSSLPDPGFYLGTVLDVVRPVVGSRALSIILSPYPHVPAPSCAQGTHFFLPFHFTSPPSSSTIRRTSSLPSSHALVTRMFLAPLRCQEHACSTTLPSSPMDFARLSLRPSR